MATEEYSIGYEQGKQDGFNEAMAQQRTAAEGEDTRRAWVGLTDEERNVINRHNIYVSDIIKATEAKLKEKNT